MLLYRLSLKFISVFESSASLLMMMMMVIMMIMVMMIIMMIMMIIMIIDSGGGDIVSISFQIGQFCTSMTYNPCYPCLCIDSCYSAVGYTCNCTTG